MTSHLAVQLVEVPES